MTRVCQINAWCIFGIIQCVISQFCSRGNVTSSPLWVRFPKGWKARKMEVVRWRRKASPVVFKLYKLVLMYPAPQHLLIALCVSICDCYTCFPFSVCFRTVNFTLPCEASHILLHSSDFPGSRNMSLYCCHEIHAVPHSRSVSSLTKMCAIEFCWAAENIWATVLHTVFLFLLLSGSGLFRKKMSS